MKLAFKASVASTASSNVVEPSLLPFEMVQSFIESKSTPNALKLQDVFNEKYIYYSVCVLDSNGKHIVVPIVLFVGKDSKTGERQLLSCNNKGVVNTLTEESAAIYDNYDDCKKFVDKANEIVVLQSFFANEIVVLQSLLDRHAEHMTDIIKVTGVDNYWHSFADLGIQLTNAKMEIADL